MEWTGARYADKPTAEVHTWIAAAPAHVWALVSDIELMPRMSPELRSVQWLDGRSGPALGARFVGRSKHEALGEWTTTVPHRRVRAAEEVRLGGRESAAPDGHLAVHIGAAGRWHSGARMDADGPGPLGPLLRNRPHAGEGTEDPAARGVRERARS